MTTTRVLDLHLGPDTHANRPAYSAVARGAFYECTTHGLIYRADSGGWTTWAAVLPAGGATGQRLVKNSGTDYDVSWGTGTGLTDPTTTKGDLIVRDATTPQRLAVGADGQVVVADSTQTLGVKYKALDDSDVAAVAPNDQTGATYTFVLADKHRLVTASNASAQTYTVPPNSSVAYALGAVLQIVQKGAGQVTLVGGSGVTLDQAHGLKTSAQWAVVSIMKILTDTWVVTGDTTT